jgi:hypothetical protein
VSVIHRFSLGLFEAVYSRLGIFNLSGQHSSIEHMQVSNFWNVLRAMNWTCDMVAAGLQRSIRAVARHKERN